MENVYSKKTNAKKASTKKTCFVVTPIGNTDSEIRRHVDGLVKLAIKPALGDEYEVKPAHEYFDSTSITKQVYQKLYESDLVIANLTGLNPNVMYELAIRFCFGKPVILIAQQGTDLPFDIDNQRTLFYRNDFMGLDELRVMLERAKDTIDYNSQAESPIHDALKQVEIFKQLKEEEKNDVGTISEALSIIMKKIDEISTENKKRDDRDNIESFVNSSRKFDILFDNEIAKNRIISEISALDKETENMDNMSMMNKMNLMVKIGNVLNQVYESDDILTEKEHRDYILRLNSIQDRIKDSEETK